MIAKPPTNLNPGCAICGLQPFAHESHHADVRGALVALQPSKSPTATTPASAAVFAKVNVFWTSVPSAEQQSAPVIVSTPAITHASKSHPGAPLKRADSADVMKMPEPIIDPITIMVASIGPSARTKPLGCWSLLILSCRAKSRHL